MSTCVQRCRRRPGRVVARANSPATAGGGGGGAGGYVFVGETTLKLMILSIL